MLSLAHENKEKNKLNEWATCRANNSKLSLQMQPVFNVKSKLINQHESSFFLLLTTLNAVCYLFVSHLHEVIFHVEIEWEMVYMSTCYQQIDDNYGVSMSHWDLFQFLWLYFTFLVHILHRLIDAKEKSMYDNNLVLRWNFWLIWVDFFFHLKEVFNDPYGHFFPWRTE